MSAIDSTANAYIGTGIIFPITLSNFGRPNVVGGKDLIEASMRDILAWSLGTKFFLGEYGGKLEQILQEPNDLVQKTLINDFTVGLINTWENRVQVLSASLTDKEYGIIYISIAYQIKNTKITGSFVYPYYSQIIF